MLGRVSKAVFSPARMPVGIAIVVIALCAAFADHQNKIVSDQAARVDVLAKVNVIRAKLEGNINGNLQLVRGLVAAVTTEPYMGEQRFTELASRLFSEESQLRNIAGAPDLVISLMYPMAGNEKAIGLDYRKNDQQRAAALRARDERRLILAGPVDLAQGGQAFIGRFPVFVKSAGNTDRFWGIVSAVVDVQRLYQATGLLDKDLGIDVALIGSDALGAKGVQFFGDQRVVKNNPVTADVLLPSGSWQIAAIPKNGWPTTPANAWLLRAIMAAAAALILIPSLAAGRLIKERQRNYGELHRLSRRLELALEASAIGVWEHDLKTNHLTWDDRVNEIYGREPDGGPRGYSDWAGAIHPDDLPGALADFDKAVAGRSTYSSEYRVVRPNGEIRHVRSTAIFYQIANNSPRMVGAEWDVTADVLLTTDLVRAKQLTESKNTELESAQARIEHIALHDSLTDLPNRRYLDQMLKDYAAKARVNGGCAALLHIDLDRFKHINDTLGHAAGDAMLVHASSVLKSNVGDHGFVARIGGDEFIVLCTVHGDVSQAAALADNIIEQMRRPVYYHGHQCRFGVSVGIAIDNDREADTRQLLVNADIALYRAKKRGRNRYEFFSGELQSEIVNTKRIADEILAGLERDEFIVFYQPQFDAKTLEIVGVEALVRWRHPEKGILTPDAFLKTAEELNVVSVIDRKVLQQSLLDFEAWSADKIGIPRVSVNVSARRLQDEELLKSLRDLNIRKGTFSFELVESIFLDNNDDLVTWNVEQIKQLGIDIEIDDFGTGYASIVSLLKLQPRRLKIDRQLVDPIVNSHQRRQVVSSIIEIGKSLGIEIIAEGVETMKHARVLKELGCDILQGYAFGHAMDSDRLRSFARSRRLPVAS
ncbi:EAL domain-containing protein [Mesorhizobium sp. ES1-4]|uniref:bifunctional diguanylate cyclase/phosphodiesterase n=1 Tax=Mesorhizobium sp. ES1-4 TaxID=2876627 RepID=UPI001CCD2743|nr:EAL domain-containing protein [Mesorhizobium sp. ES1-4]MBZ9797704.1 EAL domain-containing protein [Mesorhizobium sp. ES1-4]